MHLYHLHGIYHYTVYLIPIFSVREQLTTTFGGMFHLYYAALYYLHIRSQSSKALPLLVLLSFLLSTTINHSNNSKM